MGVIVDGVVRYRGMATGTMSAVPPPDFRREFEPSMFSAIEVYRSGAEVPIEFGGNGAHCGIIVLWTRRP
jgi:hypothetical protein